MSDFFDEARIFVSSGKGGDGSVHFRREKFVPLGGPDGGDGGRGGDVLFVGDRRLNTLQAFRQRRRFQAEDGSGGMGSRKHGRSADNVVIRVPIGTVIRGDDDISVIGEVADDGEELVVAKGGQGGLGNSHFATSTRQAPSFAEKGQPGQERWLRLELKLVADVGFVGLPNAGKSTLLASVSAARPKIADYPFTTLVPNLGVCVIDDFSFVAADIPGLIEGAHAGHGLGDRFLRHIERTRVLVHVMDASTEDPLADFVEVELELAAYGHGLMEKQRIVALNKNDLPDAQEHSARLAHTLRDRGFEAFSISGVSQNGIRPLLSAVRRVLEETRRTEDAAEHGDEEFVFTAQENPDEFTVERKRSRYVVSGQTVERVVSMTDLESVEAVAHLQRRLKRLGVFQALEKAGIRMGNRVVIGEVELNWEGEIDPGLAAIQPSSKTEPKSRR